MNSGLQGELKVQGKRAAVLGGSGFIGSHLCERLLADGAAQVVAVDSLLTGSSDNVSHLASEGRFRLQRQDITLPFEVEGPVDLVFNLASPASPRDFERLWLETMQVGSVGTENALRLAERKRAVFVQASTSEVYGDPLVHPQTEGYWGNVDSTSPRAVYDEAKRYGEAMVSAFRRYRGLSTRIARIFNTYGPRMRLDDGRVVPAFIGQALRGEDFTIYGDGTQTRSFCYVRDLVDGLVRLALSARSEVSEPVNLGNPVELSMLQFAEAVRDAAGVGGRIVHRPLPPGDPRRRRPDISRARTLLEWEPRVALADGLRETIAHFRALLDPDLPRPAGTSAARGGEAETGVL